MTTFLICVFAALGISGLCSLLEATLLSFTPSQVASLSTRRPKLGGIWQSFKQRIDQPIAAILLINTAAHTIGATLAGAQFEALFGSDNVLYFSLGFTFLMLQFTEILPKTLGVRYNGFFAPLIARPLNWSVRILQPVLYLVRLVNRPFESRAQHTSTVTLEEITALASQARLGRLIDPRQERIIQGTTQLSEQTVEEIMIPIEQVSFLSTAQTINEAIVAAHLDPHTRFPICEDDDRNQVLGYVNFKEIIYLARTNLGETSLRGIIRPVFFAEPDLDATALLRVFVERHEHMAIIRSNRGKVLGLVTLEDVIEELVGELEDEFDRLPHMFHPLKSGTWMVGGGMPVAQLADKLGLALADMSGTTSAWLIKQFGHVPKPGETHQADGATFTVRRTRRGKIFEVAVQTKQNNRGDKPAADSDTP